MIELDMTPWALAVAISGFIILLTAVALVWVMISDAKFHAKLRREQEEWRTRIRHIRY